MKRFKSILLICDEEGIHDELIGRAIWLAKSNGARIDLVDTLGTAPGELARIYGALPGSRAHDVEFAVLEFQRARLEKIAGLIKAEGIETSQTVLQGVPFIETIRKVLRDGNDLVLKGTPADPAGAFPLFASTDMHLLRKCPCPVWLMKKSRMRRFARILAAVDPDPADRQRDALNTVIMDLATSLAGLDQSELHVVNAWQLEGESTLRHNGFARVASNELDLLIEDRRMRSEDRLDAIVKAYPDLGSRMRVHLIKGEAKEVVPELANKQRADLIVMGTVARTGISGLFIGNTAEAILNHVNCSIMAVKPPGFETPVQ